MRGARGRVIAGLFAMALPLVLMGSVARAEESLPRPPAGPAAPVLPPLAVTGSTAPAPTPKGVRAQVGAIAKARALGRSGAIVLDPADGTVLLDVDGDRPLIPGSVVKLATAAAALVTLGPEARRATTVIADDSRQITLVGGGDATLTMGGGSAGTASLAELAKRVADQVQAGPVELRYDDSLFTGPALGPDWGQDYPAVGVAAPVTALMVDQGRVRPGSLARVDDPARDAAQRFRKLLKANGVKVTS
ncbi:MAG: D-alanyl-D-alanine carboxypeptidase, partial [Actinomycetales bacterium]